jgi:hypothetical protein
MNRIEPIGCQNCQGAMVSRATTVIQILMVTKLSIICNWAFRVHLHK